jgi:flagellar basal-body rod protein FlgG
MFKQFRVAATGMSAMEKDLITITDNVSNVKTTAFKKARVEFENLFPEILNEAIADTENNKNLPQLEFGSGVRVVGTPRDFTSGTIEITNNTLDIAIQGEGFLQIRMSDGTTAYTRAGNLHKDNEGKLTDVNGNLLEPEISLPQDTTGVVITTDGTVLVQENNQTSQRQVGQINLARFVNPAGLKSIGDNLYQSTVASGEPLQGIPSENGFGSIAQFSLESSNVDVVQEMMRMIMTQRAFDVISKAIQSGEGMLNSAIEVAKG